MPHSPTSRSPLAEPKAAPGQVVLGVDVGSRITGYGLVRCADGREQCLDWGCIKLSATWDAGRRLATIYRELRAVIERSAPSVMAVEGIFVSRNPASALCLGQARGVVLLAAAEADIAIVEYMPRTVKKAVTSSGGADKKQVQYMVCQLLSLSETPPEDAADALAVALCHAYRHPPTSRAAL